MYKTQKTTKISLECPAVMLVLIVLLVVIYKSGSAVIDSIAALLFVATVVGFILRGRHLRELEAAEYRKAFGISIKKIALKDGETVILNTWLFYPDDLGGCTYIRRSGNKIIAGCHPFDGINGPDYCQSLFVDGRAVEPNSELLCNRKSEIVQRTFEVNRVIYKVSLKGRNWTFGR